MSLLYYSNLKCSVATHGHYLTMLGSTDIKYFHNHRKFYTEISKITENSQGILGNYVKGLDEA